MRVIYARQWPLWPLPSLNAALHSKSRLVELNFPSDLHPAVDHPRARAMSPSVESSKFTDRPTYGVSSEEAKPPGSQASVDPEVSLGRA